MSKEPEQSEAEVIAFPQREEDDKTGRYSVKTPSGGSRFAAPLLGRALTDKTPFAKSPDGRLYVYRQGRYHDDGEASVRQRVQKVMGDYWIPKHSNEVVEWIRGGAPFLDPEPPPYLIHVRNGLLDLSNGRVTFDQGHAPELRCPISLP